MKRFYLALVAFLAVFALQAAAQARVRINIDLSSQRMTVESSSGSYVWPVSSARSGYVTPRGSYAPTSLQRMHYSRKYHNSPMPYSIFFRGGYAIHGTYATSALGRPASHGCIRLAPANAATLFKMVQNEGASISISGSPPGGRVYASTRAKHHVKVAARGKHKAHYAAHNRGHRSYASSGNSHAPMAYAPVYRTGGVKSWQHNPGWFFLRP